MIATPSGMMKRLWFLLTGWVSAPSTVPDENPDRRIRTVRLGEIDLPPDGIATECAVIVD
jgi:hypothetical protein